MPRWLLILIAVVVVVGLGGYLVFIYRPPIAELQAGQQQTFDAATIAHGAELAAIGDCTSCHTAQHGPPLAGGVAVPTPFGTVYSTNITPDRATGIGGWTVAAFVRAMREGVNRDGDHLYPAFPYDHFTHVSEDDDKALYAYLMTRDPASATAPANQLSFPFNMRWLVAGWNVLFLKQDPIVADAGQSDEWNRGRYLIEGLGHCAACHTPRNSLGAEDGGKQYAGGPIIDGWYAYPINASSPAPEKWTVDELAGYLKTGFSVQHGVSRGPMAQVTARLSQASDADVHAMATYVASLMGSGPAPPAAPPATTQAAVPPAGQSGDSLTTPQLVAASADPGAVIFSTACSSCHDAARQPPFGGIDFHRSTAVHADNPQNIINMVLFGLPAAEGQQGAVMPGFAGTLGQDDMVALLDYLRATYGDGKPAWPNLAQQVADTMSGKTVVRIYGQDGVQRSNLLAEGGSP